MSSYRPDNSDDHATWLNGPEPPPVGERGRELSAAEMNAALHRMLDPVLARIRGIEQSNHRCACGVNLEKAHCAKCSPIPVQE